MLRSVVLPEPDGPMINVTSPGSTANSTSETARTSVCPLPNSLDT